MKPAFTIYMEDKDVLYIIDTLKSEGAKIPEFKKQTHEVCPVVYYNEKGFHLYMIDHFVAPGDAGYTAMHVENFLCEGRFNFKPFEYDFSLLETAALVADQLNIIMKKIKSHQHVGVESTDDFIGVVCK